MYIQAGTQADIQNYRHTYRHKAGNTSKHTDIHTNNKKYKKQSLINSNLSILSTPVLTNML